MMVSYHGLVGVVQSQEFYIPNLVQVLPKLHLAGIRAQLGQVRTQKHLSVQNLRAVLVGHLIERALERGAAGGKGTSGNVVLEELLVDDVDDGGDEGLDVFGAGDEGFNVSCSKANLLVAICGPFTARRVFGVRR